MEALTKEWVEFLGVLSRHGVRFLLIGGHALAVHGRPRYTEDLDVFVDPTAANARRVSAAVVEFGFAETGRDWRWFAKPYRIAMLGRVPFRIDILTGISGVSFRAAWRNRISVDLSIGSVPVIGIDELRANKLASGRPKDLLDLALLDELAAPPTTPAASRSRSKRPRRAAPPSRKRGTASRRRRPRSSRG